MAIVNFTHKELEKVKGFHKLTNCNRYSMKVNKNYRITFEWHDNEVIDVNFEDYH